MLNTSEKRKKVFLQVILPFTLGVFANLTTLYIQRAFTFPTIPVRPASQDGSTSSTSCCERFLVAGWPVASLYCLRHTVAACPRADIGIARRKV